MQRLVIERATSVWLCSLLALTIPEISSINCARAEQPPSPCHPNPTADADRATVASRGDIVKLPDELKDRLIRLADRPHTYLPMQTFAEADGASQLFQYYLLDTTGFEPNVFTAIIPGVNDANVQLTVTGGNCGLPTIGAVRVVLEPKPGLPTDPNDPRAFNDVFIDMNPLFVINNESGWYEGWMIHDITVPAVAAPRRDGHAQFGTLTQRDSAILQKMGAGNNVAGNIFTVDGQKPHFPSASDHFPDVQTNVVPLHVSMGACKAQEQSDAHCYWEFNYQGTNWVARSWAKSPALWQRSAGGWGREKGRAGCEPGLLRPFSLTGIDAVPPPESSDRLQTTRGRSGAAAWGISVRSCGLACEQFLLLGPVQR